MSFISKKIEARFGLGEIEVKKLEESEAEFRWFRLQSFSTLGLSKFQPSKQRFSFGLKFRYLYF